MRSPVSVGEWRETPPDAGGEDGYADERDGHAEGFAEREFFEAEEDGEDERADGAHAED